MSFEEFDLVLESFNCCTKVNDYKIIWKNPNNNDWFVERRGTSTTPYENANEEIIQMMLDSLWMSGYAIVKINTKYKDMIKEKFHGKFELRED